MPDTDIASTTTTDMTNAVADVTVDFRNTDGATGQNETKLYNTNWSKWYGYYRTIAEVKAAIDTRAIWTIGKGWTSPVVKDEVVLERMKGWGEDTFNGILKNMIITKRIGGDAYAEIIRDEERTLLNIKPLDPGSMVTVLNAKGLIDHYEQVSKVKGAANKIFQPDEIFHLTNKRVADEGLGVSDIEAMENIILASNESFSDMKTLQHRYVQPRMAFIVDTDDATKIAAFKTQMDNAVKSGENLIIPKGDVEFELISVPSNATLNPLPWRNHLKDYYFQVVGIPQIILGSSGEFTESTAKIAYLAFQQSVEDEQKEIEEQIWRQLFIRIELEFPASLQNEMISDKQKDGESPETPVPQFQPSDTELTEGEAQVR